LIGRNEYCQVSILQLLFILLANSSCDSYFQKWKEKKANAIMSRSLAKIKKVKRKIVIMSIILTREKCSSADTVQLAGHCESVDAENI
jgi:hypothetical protein